MGIAAEHLRDVVGAGDVKRTALKRKTPLRRKTWMKRSSRRNSYARRPRDVAFMLWVKTQRCLLAGQPGHVCEGVVEADHAGDIGVRALGRKADDRTCLPLCQLAHAERQRWRGFFEGWDVPRMRSWTEAASAMLVRLYESTGANGQVPYVRFG